MGSTAIDISPITCFGCGACIMICPTHAITLSERLAKVELIECTECDLCVPMCPVEAIVTISLDDDS